MPSNATYDKDRYDAMAGQSGALRKSVRRIDQYLSLGTFAARRWSHQKLITDLQRRHVRPGARVCEMGCFMAQPTIYLSLARPDADYLACDISPLSLTKAAVLADSLHAEVSLFNADLQALPMADASVDVAFGFGILHHVHTAGAMAELDRILAPGGRAVFMEPLDMNPLIRLYRRLRPEAYSPHECPYTPARLKQLRSWAPGLETTWTFHHFIGWGYLALTALLGPLGQGRGMVRILGRGAKVLGHLDDALIRAIPGLERVSQAVEIVMVKPAGKAGSSHGGRQDGEVLKASQAVQ